MLLTLELLMEIPCFQICEGNVHLRAPRSDESIAAICRDVVVIRVVVKGAFAGSFDFE
jgi:hypothetical protein